MTTETSSSDYYSEHGTNKQIIELVVSSSITQELIDKYQKLPNIQSASKTLESIIPSLTFRARFMGLQETINDLVVKIGLVAFYVKENPKNKPPFTSTETLSGWDIDEKEQEEILTSLTPDILQAAENYTKGQPTNLDIKPEQLITAISYLKVKPHFEKEIYLPTTDEQANYE